MAVYLAALFCAEIETTKTKQIASGDTVTVQITLPPFIVVAIDGEAKRRGETFYTVLADDFEISTRENEKGGGR